MTRQLTDERVTEILRGRRAIRVVRVPGLEEDVGVRVLVDLEIDDARVDAQRYARDRAKKASVDAEKFHDLDPSFFDREFQRQVIVRAYSVVHEGTPKLEANGEPTPLFPGVNQVRRLDAQTVEDLYGLYLEHLTWVAPVRSATTEEEVSAVTAELKKGPDATVALVAFDAPTLRRLCVSLARAAHSTSQTSSSSTG